MKKLMPLLATLSIFPGHLHAQTSEAYLTDQVNFCLSANTFQGDWELIGPESYGTQNMGRIDALWIDPEDDEHLLAGSLSGGLFEKKPGENWIAKTNTLPGIGVNDIAAYHDGQDSKLVIANSTNDKRDNYGFGLFYSTDDGITWTFDQQFYDSVVSINPQDRLPRVSKVSFIPGTDGLIALVTTSPIVLKKVSFNAAWEDITPPNLPSDIELHDLDFKPDDPSVFWIAGHLPGTTTQTRVLFTTDGGETYVDVTPSLINAEHVKVSVPTATDAFVYYYSGSTARISHFAYSNSTYTCVDCSNPKMPGKQGAEFEVSPADTRVMYFGGLSNSQLYKSVNSGSSPVGIGDGGHVDCRRIVIYKSTYSVSSPGSEDEVYIGNDGGVSKTVVGGNNWINLNYIGLAVTEYYGLSGVEEQPAVLFGGTQDNQNWRFDNGVPAQFITGLDGYETESYQNAQGEIVLFYQAGTGVGGPDATDVFRRVEPAGTPDNVTPDIEGLEEYSKPVHKQPNGKFYLGMDDLYISLNADPVNEDDYASQGLNGPGFNNLVDAVSAIEVSPMDAERIYVAYWGSGAFGGSQHFKNQLFYHDPDPQINWTNRTPGFGISCAGCGQDQNSCAPYFPTCFNSITGIVSDPEDYERVWICYRGFDYDGDGTLSSEKKNGVMYSDDAGINWHAMNSGLPNFPINCIRYQAGTDDILYLGTDAGVFRWVHASGQVAWVGYWECFSNGLPSCLVRDMEINYCAQKLRIATLGRGIWESNLYPQTLISPRTQNSDTWTADRKETQSFVIPAGQTLIISNCTVNMAANTYIKIQPNGKLVLDSATLTNSCGYMWSGVQVLGDPTKKQSPATNQGVLIMKNGAKIQNAYVPAMADEAYYSGPDYTFPNGKSNGDGVDEHGGGIIQVQFNQTDPCMISNCRKGIGFGPYHSPLVSGVEPANKSYINGAVFENTGTLNPPYDNAYSMDFISMWNVHGVGISGNKF